MLNMGLNLIRASGMKKQLYLAVKHERPDTVHRVMVDM